MKGRTVNYQLLFFIGISILTSRCVEPYNPPEINQVIDILVVDGFMNTTDSTAVVKLSKAIALSDSGDPIPENNAMVRIEDEVGNIFPLTEVSDGEYRGQELTFNRNLKHRLTILTSSQGEFASDFIELKTSPPIDSITWRSNNRTPGIDILVNTHDDSGQTQYYQWTFKETWEYTAGHYSFFKIEDREVVPQGENIYQCWMTQPSTEILINATTQLQADVVRDFELTFIPFQSQKVRRKYSIEVEQRVLTKDAYDFWLQLKKTTESLGSLFDPLPSQVVGNLKNINNPSKPVLGYFSGGSITKKRIFITIYELPPELRTIPPLPCPVDTIDIDLISSYPDMNLIGPTGYPVIEGYLVSFYTGCMDCREIGGYTTQPDFWQ